MLQLTPARVLKLPFNIITCSVRLQLTPARVLKLMQLPAVPSGRLVATQTRKGINV